MPAELSSPTLVTHLDGMGLDPALVGGKAAALDRVRASGCRVPSSFAITTDAYRSFIAEPELEDLLADLSSAHDAAVGDGEIDNWFDRRPLPPALSRALAQTTAGEATARWAVRSSATAEDLQSASFAGQYRSVLDVGTADLDEAIKAVWASLWHRAPREYRWFHGIESDDIGMGVLVMPMLEPDLAGVLFTNDPLGSADTIRIELVEGLGEALVSGETTPEIVVVDRRSGAATPRSFPGLAELVDVGLVLERTFGHPQDIEWAVTDGRVHVLQARPITTAVEALDADDGFDDRLDSEGNFTTAGIAEMLPGLLGPRIWSLNHRPVEDGFRRLFELLGSDAVDLEDPASRLIVRSSGRAAVDIDALRRLTAAVPGSSTDQLEHDYFGEPDAMLDIKTAGRRAMDPSTALRQGARTLRTRADAAMESEIAIQIVDALLAVEPDLADLADRELLALRARAEHVAGRVIAAEIVVAAMATASYQSVERFLRRHLPAERVSAATRRATTNVTRSDETVLSAIEALCADHPVVEHVAHLDWPTAERALNTTEDGRRFLDALHRTLARAGSMAVFGGPTWDEAPTGAWSLVTAVTERAASGTHRSGTDPDAAIAAIESEIAATSAWRYGRAVSGHLVDVRRHFFRREAREAAAFLARREAAKAALLRLGGIVRRIDLEIGCRLALLRRIEERDDVDFIAGSELPLLFAGVGPTPAAIALRRRSADLATERGPLPRRFHGEPETTPAPEPIGDEITGWAASSGTHTGRACLVTDPRDHELRRGDVLVASNTDASWAPLFLSAGAIVVEEGGPLSHAAIVARELGVPAVVNAVGIVDRVASSDCDAQLFVDGTNGRIALGRPSTTTAPDAAAFGGLAPTREPPAIAKTPEPRLGVFVTGLIGAGAVMSAIFAATETIGGRRAERRYHRRAAPIAALTAHAVVHGFDDAARTEAGLAVRDRYAWSSAALALLSGFMLAESTDTYLDSGTAGAALLWAVMLTSGLWLGVGAAYAGVAAWRYPAVPVVVRWLARTGVAGSPATRHRTDHATWAAAAMAAMFVVLLAANLWIPAAIARLDVWAHGAIGASADNERIGPDWLRWFGQPWFVIPLAIAIGVASFRCRVLAIGLPAGIVAAGLINASLWWLVGKQRPDEGIHALRADSFPGGHAITVTLLFGLLPLAVHVMAQRRRLTIAVRLGATAVMAVLLVDQIRQGGHWPTDQFAGLLLGGAGVVGLHGLVGSQSAHYRCRSCPWSIVSETSGPVR